MASEPDRRIFDCTIREDLMHTVVVAQQAARRAGTAATKNRALVSGGGRKPWRQKGTGRARTGTVRGSQWAGGGVTFGPQPRSYAQRIPKKVRRAALRSALSLRHSEGRVQIVDEFRVDEMKTRRVVERLAELAVNDVLIVTAERDTVLERAARNLPRVRVLAAGGLNVRDVLAREHLVLTQAAHDALLERLQ